VPELVASNPLELKTVFEEGQEFPAHLDIDVIDFSSEITASERTEILNFLIAPDGQRLFAINCSNCHGRSVAFAGEDANLHTIITQGGLHLEMPPWREELTDNELDTLAAYVIDPATDSDGEGLFTQYCSTCHGERLPAAGSLEETREIIASGGAHETMPVWGDVLTDEQVDALVSYTIEAARGTSLEVGRELYAQNCALCHGDFGEGGANPARPDDIIAPISTSEYLKTRDDFTLRAVIAQGQPNFGMSPFGSFFGGPLDDEDVDAIVAFMRSWEDNPPVELPPEIIASSAALTDIDIYATLCAQCHGENGEGLLGPALNDPQFQSANTDQDIFDTINLGHEATSMIAWGEILTADQIQELVQYLRQLSSEDSGSTAGPPSFVNDVLPIFEAQCNMCHGTLGGWDGTTYDSVMTTGDNAPVIIPRDIENSLLAQKITGTQTMGAIMPTGGLMSTADIQTVLDWIANGAQDD
jgi:mono/diheme cytochrome c family protein